MNDPHLAAYVALANLMPFVLEDYHENCATPDFKTAVEAAKAAIARKPVEEIKQLRDTCPLVLYFPDEESRAAFIEEARKVLKGVHTLPL